MPARAILATLSRLRTEGQARVGLSKFARTCHVDKLLELPEEMAKKRYCFPADALLNGADCCTVQERFAGEVARLQADPGPALALGRLRCACSCRSRSSSSCS